MARRLKIGVEEELDIKKEFYKISSDGVNYEKIPEKYQTITASSPSSRVLHCRLCTLPNDDMVDIFTVVETEDNIIDMIECCLRIVVKETDNRPKQICRSCSDKLKLCYQFNKIVEDAEKQFHASEEEHSTGLSVENILVLPSPEPSSGSMDHNETLCSNNLTNGVGKKLPSKNEYQKVDSSTFDTNSGSTSVLDIFEQITCDSQVFVMTRSRSRLKKQTSNAQCERGLQDQDNLVVSDGPDTKKRCIRYESATKKRHVRNLKNRDYCCSVCGRSYKHVSTLKMHMTAHSDVRLWECNHCKKCFKTKGHLQKHLRICKKRTEH